MIKLIWDLWRKFNRTDKLIALFILSTHTATAALEAIVIGFFYLLIKALNAPDSIETSDYLSFVARIIGDVPYDMFITFLLLGILGIFLIKHLLTLLLGIVNSKFAANQTSNYGTKTIATIAYQPFEFHLKWGFATINKITTNAGLLHIKISSLINLLADTLTLCALTAVLFRINVLAALACSATGAIFIAIFYYFQKKYLTKLGSQTSQAQQKVNENRLQLISGIKEIKLLNREEYFLKKYKKNIKTEAYNAQLLHFINGLPKIVLEMFFVIVFSVIIFVTIKLGNIQLIFPLIGTYAVIGFRILPILSRISYSVSTLKFYDKLMRDVEDLNLQKIIPKKDADLTDLPDIQLRESIKVKNIYYQYGKTGEKVLQDVNLEIKAGQMAGFVGQTGAGKTTLLDIIIGLLSAYSGVVEVDGCDINKNLNGWHKQIGYIPQATYLADVSILRNIAIGLKTEEINIEAAITALKKAQLWDFVNSLPNKLDTVIGERGVRISGGQRQRLGIARALYNDPPILFMDEATSALDQETENWVVNSLSSFKGEKTLLIIAHRLTTVQRCDIIFHLKNGKIVASGDYEKIVGEKGEKLILN